ncbi:MAG: TerB N-terminal domain-containing protein, partial [Treponema sp.]|nr:TerB N-terminal domain-containing protein [Treponema sp.]
MLGKSIFESLTEPFFTLEYDPGKHVFIRTIPPGAEDLKDGRFRYKGRLLRLPGSRGGEEPLGKKILGGREILAMARRGYGPLIRSGPVPAERGERLMELALKTAPPVQGVRRPVTARGSSPVSEITILLSCKVPKEEWLPLEGLGNYRLFQNRIYEIIPDETAEILFAKGRREGGAYTLTLKGEEIPAFADLYARLIYVFADPPLYRILCQENLFIPPEKLSLVLRCAPMTERGVGRAVAAPALKYNKKLFSAAALSRQFRSAYIALEDKWVRRETLEETGIGTLGRYINGETLEPLGIKSGTLFCREGGEMRGLWEKIEFDRERWRKYGGEKELFFAHLDFLRAWGLSGGVVSGGDREKTAAFLAAWLKSLAAELGRAGRDSGDFFDAPLPGRVLVLMKKGFWEKRLRKDLPQNADGLCVVPGGGYSGVSSLTDPRFRGIGIGFYRDFLKERGESRQEPLWDMLILTGPEELLCGGEPASLHRDLLRELEAIKTRLRLGIFFSSQDLFHNPRTKEMKAFFGIRGNLRSLVPVEIEKYLIRDTGDLLSPPPLPPGTPRTILRPPSPWRGRDKAAPPVGEAAGFPPAEAVVIGGGRFFGETKFRNLRGAEYRAEQECFFREGKRLLASPSGVAEGGFDRLSPEEREAFFWWRGEFRKGRNRETGRPFILLYARELVLLMGGGKSETAFEELRRLREAYREIYPDLDSSFPKWLLDFGILYKINEETLASILPALPSPEPGLLGDLYLHKKYIEENNSLVTGDFEGLLGGGKSGPFPGLDFSAPLRDSAKEAFGAALNRIDRFLRQAYGKKLLEFFYPLPPREESITAFEGLAGLGHSAYTAQWLSFSSHKPFLSFLSSLASFLEYRIKKEAGFDRPRNPPHLDPLWKYLSGLADTPIPAELGLPPVELEKEKITRLREESDAVRTLLLIDQDPGQSPPSLLPPLFPLPSSPSSPSSLSSFLAELTET